MADENGSSSSQENNDSEDSPMPSPVPTENIFEVESIIGRMKCSGVMKYKVRWKGYGPADDTWEPADNLSSCLDFIDTYNIQQDEIIKKRSEERKRKQAIREGRLPPEPTEGASPYPPNFKNEFYNRLESGMVDFTLDQDMYSKVKDRVQSKSSETDDKQKLLDSPDTGSEQKRQKARRRNTPGSGKSNKQRSSSGKAKSTSGIKQRHTSHSKHKKHSTSARKIVYKDLVISTDSETDSDLHETSTERAIGSAESVASADESNDSQESRLTLGSSEVKKLGRQGRDEMVSSSASMVGSSQCATGQEARTEMGGGEYSTSASCGAGRDKTVPSSDETVNYSFSSVSDGDVSRLNSCLHQEVDTSQTTVFQSPKQKDDDHDKKKKKKKKKKKSHKDHKHHRRKEYSAAASQSSSPGERKRKLTESSLPEIAGKVHKAEPCEEIKTSLDTMQVDDSVRDEQISPAKSEEPEYTDYMWLGSCKPEIQKDDDEDLSSSAEQGMGNNFKQETESDVCHQFTSEQGTRNNIKHDSDECQPCTSRQGTSTDSPVVGSDHLEPMDVKEEREEMETTSNMVPGTSDFGEPFPRASGDSRMFPDFKSSIDLSNKHLQLGRSHSRDSLSRVKVDECGDNSASSSPKGGDKKDLKFSRTDSADTRDSGINSPGSELGTASSVGSHSDKGSIELGMPSSATGPVGSESGMASSAGGQIDNVSSESSAASSAAGQNDRVLASALMEDFPGRALVMDQDELEIDLDDSGWDFLRMRMNLPNVENLTLTNSEFADALKAGDYQLVKDSLNNPSQEYDVEQADSTGITLLMFAVQNKYDDIVELLLQHGANVNVQNTAGITPLMMACQEDLSSLAVLLLRHGANVNMQCVSGESALMMSAMQGNRQIVRTLLQHGANFNMVTLSGFSAWSCMSSPNHCDIESALIQHRDRLFACYWKAVCCIKPVVTPRHLSPLFAPQLFNVRDGEQFQMVFNYPYGQGPQPGLLFIGHAQLRDDEMQVLLWGQCAVESALMNGYVQIPCERVGNFAFTVTHMLPGKNVLQINPVRWAPEDSRTLIVCLYQ